MSPWRSGPDAEYPNLKAFVATTESEDHRRAEFVSPHPLGVDSPVARRAEAMASSKRLLPRSMAAMLLWDHVSKDLQLS